jgi:hypothetical protein
MGPTIVYNPPFFGQIMGIMNVFFRWGNGAENTVILTLDHPIRRFKKGEKKVE